MRRERRCESKGIVTVQVYIVKINDSMIHGFLD